MRRRTLGLAGSLVALIGLAVLLGEPEEAYAYPSTQAIARDISELGCRRLYPARLPIDTYEAGTCSIGSAEITIIVTRDPSLMERLEEPTSRSGVSWVRGPNWIVATMDRTAAGLVALALSGDLLLAS
jgi:hypothetical protein